MAREITDCKECGKPLGWVNNEWETPFILEEKHYCFDCWWELTVFND